MNKFLKNSENSHGYLDGTPGSAYQLLTDLVALAGQENTTHTSPVLELQFGEVLTKTSLIKFDGLDYLSITAILPEQPAFEYLSASDLQRIRSQDCGTDNELLWHADQGQYVLMRKISLTAFADDTALMDAIMDSADQASAWHARLYSHFSHQSD